MSKLSMNKLSIFVIATLCAGSTLAAENVKKVSPQDLARYWLLESRTAQQANIPWRGKNLNAPTCAAVAYTIGNDGRTVDVVSHMRFAATAQNAQRLPVRTYVAMPFNLPDANSPSAADRARREQALAACKLGGYGNDNDVVIPVR